MKSMFSISLEANVEVGSTVPTRHKKKKHRDAPKVICTTLVPVRTIVADELSLPNSCITPWAHSNLVLALKSLETFTESWPPFVTPPIRVKGVSTVSKLSQLMNSGRVTSTTCRAKRLDAIENYKKERPRITKRSNEVAASGWWWQNIWSSTAALSEKRLTSVASYLPQGCYLKIRHC